MIIKIVDSFKKSCLCTWIREDKENNKHVDYIRGKMSAYQKKPCMNGK